MSAPRPLVEAEIDLERFRGNVRFLMDRVRPAELLVVVKANAYGHGRLPMALEAIRAGVGRIGCLDLETAFVLRDAGIPHEIELLAWLYPPGEVFDEAIRRRVSLGVSSLVELAAIREAAERVRDEPGFAPPRLHLKIDTGLHRNGATIEDWPVLVGAAVAAEREGLVRACAIWTHIAEASEDEDTEALMLFHRAVAEATALGMDVELRHLAASSAGHRREDVRLDMVRMGGHCWGIPSIDGVTPQEIGLEPPMTLAAQVLAVRDGRVWVSAGYADGVPGDVAGRAEVTIDGARYPVLAVHRDELVAGIGDGVRAPEPGERATLFGPGDAGEQTVRTWGDLTDTLGDEIAARIPARVPRRYVNASGPLDRMEHAAGA